MASTDPNDCSTRRKQVERGDCGGGYRWMPRSEVRNAKRDACTLRFLRHHRCGHPRIHRVTRRVGDTDEIIAVPLAASWRTSSGVNGQNKKPTRITTPPAVGAPIQRTREATAPCNSLYHLDFSLIEHLVCALGARRLSHVDISKNGTPMLRRRTALLGLR